MDSGLAWAPFEYWIEEMWEPHVDTKTEACHRDKLLLRVPIPSPPRILGIIVGDLSRYAFVLVWLHPVIS
jgi:hypothetical protein